MDGACFGPSCAGLKTQAMATANKCAVKKTVNEDTDGCESLFLLKYVYVLHADLGAVGLDKLPGTGEWGNWGQELRMRGEIWLETVIDVGMVWCGGWDQYGCRDVRFLCCLCVQVAF